MRRAGLRGARGAGASVEAETLDIDAVESTTDAEARGRC